MIAFGHSTAIQVQVAAVTCGAEIFGLLRTANPDDFPVLVSEYTTGERDGDSAHNRNFARYDIFYGERPCALNHQEP